MNELDVVNSTAADTGLLGAGADDEDRRQHAAYFTRLVAWRLRDLGWGNLRKTTGNQVAGLSVDALIHRTTGEIRDIIRNAGGADAAPQWLYQGKDDPARYVAPVDSSPPPPPPPPGDDVDARLARLEARYAAGLEACERLIDYCLELHEELRAKG